MSVRTWAAVGLAAVCTVLIGAVSVMAIVPCTGLVIPAYFADDAAWAAVGGSGSRSVILNPASGPGGGPDPAWVTRTAQARAAGAAILGYVDTDHGQRDAGVVRAEISAYRTWYDVDGVFFDRAAREEHLVGWYADLAGHAQTVGAATVVLNPGTPPAEVYTAVADQIVTFEGPLSAHQTAVSPDWMRHHPAERFVHLVYDAPSVMDLWSSVQRARGLGAGNVFVTDDAAPNPWDRLPRYWRIETALTGSRCR